MDKRFIVSITIILLLFTPFNLMAAKKSSKKIRFEFFLTKYISTSFEPESMNLAMNFADSYDNAALYLIDAMLLRGSGWDALDSRICLDTEVPTAKGKVLSKSFSYKPGDIFPLTQQRNFALFRSGIPFQVGIDIHFANTWCVGVNYFESEKYRFEHVETHDYFTIETLEKLPGPDIGYSWWEMDLQRIYEKTNSSSSFRNLGIEVSVRYDLLSDSRKITFSPEVGVSLNYIKRKFDQEQEFYGYMPTLFPQMIFPENPLDGYRELNDVNNFREDSTSRPKARFFAGLNLHFSPIRVLGFSCTARIYNKKLYQEYPTNSVLGDFPFGLSISQFFFSAGITLSILN